MSLQTSDDAAYDAPCGCPECDQGVQPGHFTCEVSPQEMLDAEEEGKVYRAYDNGRWRWFVD